MKTLKTLTLLFTLAIPAFADLTNVWASADFLNKNNETKIIDIRTPEEWKETGVIKNSHLITFFDRKGNFDLPKFLKELDGTVHKGERFAIICLTGSRTREVGRFLAYEKGYNVINLGGGIAKLISEGYPLTKPQ